MLMASMMGAIAFQKGLGVTHSLAHPLSTLAGLHHAISDGIDVRGYLHWSLLDNYEWGSYQPAFGLIAVDRDTFARTAKPSARWLGAVAAANALKSCSDNGHVRHD